MPQDPTGTRPDAEPLLSALGAAMAGDLSRFVPGLAGPTDPRPAWPAARLLDGAMMDGIMGLFAGKVERADPRAVVSVWSLSYFTAVLPPLLSAIILLDRLPAIALDEVAFIVAPDLRVQALKVAVEAPGAGNGQDRFGPLVWSHLAPVIELIAARSPVTRRVLWSNAGHVFEAFLRMLDPAAAGRPAMAEARSLLATPLWPAGARNPLFNPVTYQGETRIRRVCCMRYLIPEWKLCSICPLSADNPARLRAAAAM